MNQFNPLDHPVCLDRPIFETPTTWLTHIPFAMMLVSALRPEVIVELGTYGGASYCAFCQAVARLRTGTKCYAIDTWEGDAHSGPVEDKLLEDLKAHHDPLYRGFSRLVRSTFDDALKHFTDGSIDLIHIDGYHTYEAVTHDFEMWLPKMSERGVMLFHDTEIRAKDFGVWKFWEEVREEYASFEFLHGCGLGVLAVGKDVPKELPIFSMTDKEDKKIFTKFFKELGMRLAVATK